MTAEMAWGDDQTRARSVTVFLDNAHMTDQPGEPIATRPNPEGIRNPAIDTCSGWDCLSAGSLGFAVGANLRVTSQAQAPWIRGGR